MSQWALHILPLLSLSPLSPLPSPLSPLPSPLSPLPSLLSPLPSPLSPLSSPLSPLPSPLSPLSSPLSPLPSLSPLLPSPLSLSPSPPLSLSLFPNHPFAYLFSRYGVSDRHCSILQFCLSDGSYDWDAVCLGHLVLVQHLWILLVHHLRLNRHPKNNIL